MQPSDFSLQWGLCTQYIWGLAVHCLVIQPIIKLTTKIQGCHDYHQCNWKRFWQDHLPHLQVWPQNMNWSGNPQSAKVVYSGGLHTCLRNSQFVVKVVRIKKGQQNNQRKYNKQWQNNFSMPIADRSFCIWARILHQVNKCGFACALSLPEVSYHQRVSSIPQPIKTQQILTKTFQFPGWPQILHLFN